MNWNDAARNAGVRVNVGGADVAREVLEHVIGEAGWLAAIDCYLGGEEGAEAARSVLSLVRPRRVAAELRAMCDDPRAGPDDRVAAMELFRVVLREDDAPWTVDKLSDSSPGVQLWAADALVNLSERVELSHSTRLQWAALLESHGSEQVRALAPLIRGGAAKPTMR